MALILLDMVLDVVFTVHIKYQSVWGLFNKIHKQIKKQCRKKTKLQQVSEIRTHKSLDLRQVWISGVPISDTYILWNFCLLPWGQICTVNILNQDKKLFQDQTEQK